MILLRIPFRNTGNRESDNNMLAIEQALNKLATEVEAIKNSQ